MKKLSGWCRANRGGLAALAGGGSLDIRQRSWFNPNFEFQWFFLPNLIGMLSFMLGLVVTGLSIAREREAGTFDQLLVSPATPTEIASTCSMTSGMISFFRS